jgi:Flp pilus assembly pilin Flp
VFLENLNKMRGKLAVWLIRKFWKSDSGAVAVDWTVLSGSIVGLGVAVYGTVSNGLDANSSAIDSQLSSQLISTSFGSSSSGTTAWNGQTASDYVAYGQSLAPGNNGAVYGHATQAASDDAPSGYNFDNPLYDADSGNVIYTSNDGLSYSVGGEVSSVDSFSGSPTYFGA